MLKLPWYYGKNVSTMMMAKQNNLIIILLQKQAIDTWRHQISTTMFLKVPTLSSWTCMDSKEKEEHDLEVIQNTWWFFAIGYIYGNLVLSHTSTYTMLFDRFMFTIVHMEGSFAKSYLLLNKIGSFQIKSPVLRCLGHKGLIIEYYRCLSKE